MPRKIKVVPITSSQTEMSVDTNPLVEIPNDTQVVVPEIETKTVIPEIETEVIPEIEITSKVEQEEEIKPKKSYKYAKCEFCDKEMLEKNLRYAHPKVCKLRPKPPEDPPPPPIIPNIVIDKVIVNSNVSDKPETIYNDVKPKITPQQQFLNDRQTKLENRKEKIKYLIAQAF